MNNVNKFISEIGIKGDKYMIIQEAMQENDLSAYDLLDESAQDLAELLDVNRITTGVRMPRRAVLKRVERFATSIRRSTVCALNLDAGGSPSRGPLKSESLAQLKQSMLTLCRAQPEIEHVD